MTGKDEWEGRVGESWASEWQRTDLSFSNLTPRLVDRILGRDFTHAVDIGCGAGELAFRVAAERPDAEILGLDVSPALIEAARLRSGDYPNLAFELWDASQWSPAEGAAPQICFSRHGVMFFDDPVAAFANLHAAMAQGGFLTFSCFRSLADNPFFAQIGALLPKPETPPDPHAPGPFAFADSERVGTILREAGWRDVAFERVDFAMIAGTGDKAVEEATVYFNRIGPAARAIAQMDEADRPPIREAIARFAADHHRDGEVSLPASVWIVSASAN